MQNQVLMPLEMITNENISLDQRGLIRRKKETPGTTYSIGRPGLVTP